MILTTALIANPIPKLELPDPPAYMEGDDDNVTVRLGEIRQSMYYYEIVPILMEHINKVQDIAVTNAKEADHEFLRRIQAESQLSRVKDQRNMAIIVGSAGIVLGGIAVWLK